MYSRTIDSQHGLQGKSRGQTVTKKVRQRMGGLRRQSRVPASKAQDIQVTDFSLARSNVDDTSSCSLSRSRPSSSSLLSKTLSEFQRPDSLTLVEYAYPPSQSPVGLQTWQRDMVAMSFFSREFRSPISLTSIQRKRNRVLSICETSASIGLHFSQVGISCFSQWPCPGAGCRQGCLGSRERSIAPPRSFRKALLFLFPE